ncbi:MAG: 30S ribosomal protein S16, partial [Acidimicrobiia bacterium]|nr:30S ribosomal protein S16 [Acidimicrobiia bacterium]
MAVKLRLMRMGKKKHPTYRVVAADSRSPRDGRFIELIGRYDPHHEPSVVEIDNDRANYWLGVGAQPTAAVRKLLEISGAWTRFAMARGDIHVVDASPPPPPADQPSEEAEPEPDAIESTPNDSAASAEEPVAPESAEEEPAAQEAVAEEAQAEQPQAEEPEKSVAEKP